jgi:hypothetical protein
MIPNNSTETAQPRRRTVRRAGRLFDLTTEMIFASIAFLHAI